MDKKQTILVTGGAGYIGSITVKSLISTGYNVVVVDSLENGHREAVDQEAILEIANVGDMKAIGSIFNKYKPNAVIDFAAYLAVGESMVEPEKYFRNNVENFINLLDAMVKNNCKLIIKSSTASVYGNPLNDNDFPLTENYIFKYKPEKSCLLPGKFAGQDTEGEEFFQKFIELYNRFIVNRTELKLSNEELTTLRIPTSVYGLSKLLDEIIMKKYDSLFGLKSVTLRYFNVCGAMTNGNVGEDKPNPTTLMTVAISQIIGKRDKLEIFGNDYPTKDGTGIRDYIHVVDLADGHIKALQFLLNNKTSETFNLGTGKGASVMEIVEAVEEASHKKVNFVVCPRRSGDPVMSFADAKKANSILLWKTRHSIEDMAESAWKWHSTHPDGYNSKVTEDSVHS